MSEEMKTIVITAAGTGGHVMPGLAVAREVRARGWSVEWIGTTTGMEGALVQKDTIPFHAVDFQGIRGKGLWGSAKNTLKMVAAFFKARRLLKQIQPKAVFSTGGYIAVPVALAARNCHIPIILMNCDADLLMSTDIVRPYVDAIACGFAGGARSQSKGKGYITGNPVRADIMALTDVRRRLSGRTGPLKLFVFGGSLGAKVLNEVLPEALALIPEQERPLVVHQTGRDRDEAVRQAYERCGVKADVRPFIDDMAKEYAECDLVMCRSGATSVSEICAAGVPAILVPFVAKTTTHQLGNARYMAGQEAAILLEQPDVSPERVKALLMDLTRERLIALGEKAHTLGKKYATRNVADLIEAVVEQRKPNESEFL